MTTMSLGLELALFADRIPFLAERNYTKLPEIKKDSMPEPIADVWTALALLVKRHNDQTIRVLIRHHCPENQHGCAIIRVGVACEDGYHIPVGCDSNYSQAGFVRYYSFPVTESVVEELVCMGYVGWTNSPGLQDFPNSTKLKLTEYGQAALIEHLSDL